MASSKHIFRSTCLAYGARIQALGGGGGGGGGSATEKHGARIQAGVCTR
jgi:hypothetical protein